jgi:chlorite dismutase
MVEQPKTEKEQYKEFIEYLQNKKGATIWEIADYFKGEDADYIYFQKAFTPEQLALLKAIVEKTVAALDWHDSYSESHEDIREKLNNSDAKLRNHRHSLENFSARPEF